MAPTQRSEVSAADRARVAKIAAQAHALYLSLLELAPDWSTDPLGAAAWRLNFRSTWDHRFNVDTLRAIETGRANGLSWLELTVAAGRPDSEANRFRSRQSWRLAELAKNTAGQSTDDDVRAIEDASDAIGGMPLI